MFWFYQIIATVLILASLNFLTQVTIKTIRNYSGWIFIVRQIGREIIGKGVAEISWNLFRYVVIIFYCLLTFVPEFYSLVLDCYIIILKAWITILKEVQ
jgi:hypothetical protein